VSGVFVHPFPSLDPHPPHSKQKTKKGEPLRDVGLFIGEFGVYDYGDNAVNNTDTTVFTPADRSWLKLVSRYLNALSWQNGPASWVFWSWNVRLV
jgi:hypothetical protein